MISALSTHTRTPSSTVALKRYSPAPKSIVLVQRAEKSSAGTFESGEPAFQLKTTILSLRVTTGDPDRSRLLKYSPFHSMIVGPVGGGVAGSGVWVGRGVEVGGAGTVIATHSRLPNTTLCAFRICHSPRCSPLFDGATSSTLRSTSSPGSTVRGMATDDGPPIWLPPTNTSV